jgi:N-methylhydantoinase A
VTWRLAVDIGGTFTDLVAWDREDGAVKGAKVLTVPDDPVAGVVAAIEHAGISLRDTEAFVHGSTIAINAVLQSSGAKTALLTTRGFRDVLEMGRKSRPDMYNLFFRPRRCLVPRELRLEVAERLDSRGAVIEALDAAEVDRVVSALPSDVESLAICFLHSYADARHERAAADAAQRTRPGLYISPSSALSREYGEYERASTAALNAYVGPLVSRYIDRLAAHLEREQCPAPLLITQSNGGTMTSDVARRQPVRTVESGPAAGVMGAAWLGRHVRRSELIAFDMGGTSAKACVIERGEPETAGEYFVGGRVAGLPVQVPFLDIVEVGAGGGSIAYVDAGGGLRVGPRSAGSVPGPAAYALGGTEPTITDANLALGRIDPDYFLGGEMRLDKRLAEASIARLAAKLGLSDLECALGIVRVANAIMSAAIRSITLERGRDPRDFTLVAYGGAGPVHAATLAAELQVPELIVPAGAGMFGAFGMLVTDRRHDVARTLVGRLDRMSDDEVDEAYDALELEAREYVTSRFAERTGAVTHIRRVDLRYVGQFHPITLTVPAGAKFSADVAALFHEAHAERYGHNAPAEPIEVGALRATAVAEVEKPSWRSDGGSADGQPSDASSRAVVFDDGATHECAVHRRDGITAGTTIRGPAIVEDPSTNIVISLGDEAELLAGGHLRVTIGASR